MCVINLLVIQSGNITFFGSIFQRGCTYISIIYRDKIMFLPRERKTFIDIKWKWFDVFWLNTFRESFNSNFSYSRKRIDKQKRCCLFDITHSVCRRSRHTTDGENRIFRRCTIFPILPAMYPWSLPEGGLTKGPKVVSVTAKYDYCQAVT